MVALITAVFWHVFINPTYENEHLIQHPETKKKDVDPARAARFHTYVIIWLILVAVTSFIQFAYYSNMFAVFAGQYHAINTQTDQWKVFVGVGVGAAVGGLTYRRGIRWFPTVFNERVLTLAGAWGMFVVLMLVIPYHGSTAVPSEVTFYASSGIFGATVVIGSSAIETVFSKKVTQYQDVAGKNIGKLLGAFYMATAAGRFAGPLVAGAVTQIATPSGDVFYCPNGWTSVDANGDPTCKNAAGQPLPGSCAITSDYYYVSGCVLWHAIPFYAALAGVQVVLCLALHFMLWKHWHYTD